MTVPVAENIKNYHSFGILFDYYLVNKKMCGFVRQADKSVCQFIFEGIFVAFDASGSISGRTEAVV